LQAEIVTIGTELLLGEIVDTNSAWIAQRLTTIGLNMFYTTTVGDNLTRIADVLRAALERSDVVITTGGLGPTVDDMTREAVAIATGRELVLDEDLVQEIACFFSRRNAQMTDNNRKQACLPAGARIIHNPVGTAPSFAVEHNEHVIISLPGVPHEMRHLMENEVLPYLRQRFDLQGIIKSRVLRTCGIGESVLGAQIDDLMQLSNPTVGTAAHPGQTDVRITVKAASEAEADTMIAPVERQIRERVGEYIFGVDQQTLSDVLIGLIAERELRLATVESSTRGELARQLGDAAKGRPAFAGGVVALDAKTLQRSLGLSIQEIGQSYPNHEIAEAAARAAGRLYGADLGLAVIGPADLTIPDAPPVYFSLATSDAVIAAPPRKGRSDPAGRGWLIHLAMDLARRQLQGLPIR